MAGIKNPKHLSYLGTPSGEFKVYTRTLNGELKVFTVKKGVEIIDD